MIHVVRQGYMVSEAWYMASGAWYMASGLAGTWRPGPGTWRPGHGAHGTWRLAPQHSREYMPNFKLYLAFRKKYRLICCPMIKSIANLPS